MRPPPRNCISAPEQHPRGVAICSALLGLYLFSALTLDWARTLSYYDQHRLTQLAVFAAIAILALAHADTRHGIVAELLALPRTALALLAGIALAGVASAARALSPLDAFAELGVLTGITTTSFALAAELRARLPRARMFALGVLALCTGVYTLRFLASYAAALASELPILVPDLYPNFVHLRFFSQFASWTLPLIVLPALLAPTRSLRAASWLLAVLWWMLHFGTGTRGTTVGLLAAAVFVPLVLAAAGRRWLLAQAAAALGGAALYFLLLGIPQTLSANAGIGRLALTMPNSRHVLLADAWQMIVAHPWLGAGPQHYAAVPAHWAAHPHNALAQWAAEWGVPSTLMLLAALGWGLIAWLRRARAASDTPRTLTAAALTGAAVTASVHALVSGIIVMPVSQMSLAVVLGWMLAEHRAAPPPRLVRGGRIVRWAIAALPLLGTALWAPVALRDASSLPQRTQTYREATAARINPRFWLQGMLRWDPRLDTPSPAVPDTDPSTSSQRPPGT